MNQTKARQIRKLVGYDPKNPDPILKRAYRRAKRNYTRLSIPQKHQFNNEINKLK